MRFVQAKSNAHARKKRWLQSQRTPSASSARSARDLCSRVSWNGVRMQSSDTSEKTYDTTSATNGSDAREPEEGPAERRRDEGHRRVAGLLGSGRGRELPPGTTERNAPSSATLKNTYIDAFDERDERDRHDGDVVDGDRDESAETATMRTTSAATMIRLRLSRSATTPATNAEERPGHDAREADDARLRRRVRHREHEERIRDRGRLGADRRERLPALEQDEVAIAAERGDERHAASAGSTSTASVSASASRRVNRYAAERRSTTNIATISKR